MYIKSALFSLLCLFYAGVAFSGEIGFIEKFSLAEDRSVPLEELVPGTEDYYFYHCLHYQHTGEYAKVRELLKTWIKRYNYTTRVKEIQNRNALLEYEQNPRQSLAHIRKELQLDFNHQKQEIDQKTNHPIYLDPKRVNRETLRHEAFSNYSNLNGFEESAFDFLFQENLKPNLRRDFLSRLKRPDYPNLANLVVEDLKYKHSGGFGSLSIHSALLLSQMDETLRLMPELINNTIFIRTYLKKLQPSHDVNWRYDIHEKKAYLERLLSWTRRLPPAENSLKAHVLYHQLRFDQSQGKYSIDLFMEYLKLPRNVFYMDPKYLNQPQNRYHQANIQENYLQDTLLLPIENDEPLVRDFLMNFLKEATDYKRFWTFIREDYLKEVFAETKLVNGIGDMEAWYSLLTPEKVKALKERIDLAFLPINPEEISIDDPVFLEVAIKNVKNLIVKIYKINTQNFYRTHEIEITTGIDLDGLVANKEEEIYYNEVPLRRHQERLSFPHITKPGVYIIECIGNGKSSRALIRKGNLTFTERIGSAGHVFRIISAKGELLKKTKIWLSGHEYVSEENGEIVIPFSSQPKTQKIVLEHDGFSYLEEFYHQSENYTLLAGMHVDRESLIEEQSAKIVIRPELSLNGIPVDVNLLEKPTLIIESTDLEGIFSSKMVKEFKLYNDKESVYEFKVPKNLSYLAFTLIGEVHNLSKSERVDLQFRKSFELNGIDKTEKVDDLHLRRIEDQYVLLLLGKTGEPKGERSVHFSLKHHDFTRDVRVVLQTDANGEIHLGELKEIDWVSAKGPHGNSHKWVLVRDEYTYPESVHGLQGKDLSIPYVGKFPDDPFRALSVLEKRGKTFVADHRDKVTFSNGFFIFKNLPAGDFDLLLKETRTHITIRITNGKKDGNYLLSKDRVLEIRDPKPLQITSLTLSPKGDMAIKLKNATDQTRLHVIATRFLPAFKLFETLGAYSFLDLSTHSITRPISQYLSGRKIGDEYRYILERRYGAAFPGNMLKQPTLLLNPWSLGKTETEVQTAARGEEWYDKDEEGRMVGGSMKKTAPSGKVFGLLPTRDFANLNFLPEESLVLANLRPDERGVVYLDKKQFGPRQQIHVMAIDPRTSVYRETSLPAFPEPYQDRRLSRGLNPKGHFSEQKNISVVSKGETFVLEDITTSSLELYDSLAKVYSLFMTLTNDATLKEFSFLLEWHLLKPEKRRELYSKFASHELNFFLFKKDPPFFQSVILPYLENKKDKTFLDHWFLKNDLSGYLNSWAFSRLNIVERILLGQRIEEENDSISTHVKDLFDLIPPDQDRLNYLFTTALRGSALEVGDAIGLGGALDKVAPMKKQFEREEEGRETGSSYKRKLALRSNENSKARGMRGFTNRSSKIAASEAPMEIVSDDMYTEEELVFDLKEGEKSDFAKDRDRRQRVRQFFRTLDKTEEWIENNYYHIPIENQLASLVNVNAFWKDYAAHPGDRPFLSTHFAESTRNFTEMMFALSVLDLPWTSPKQDPKYVDAKMELLSPEDFIVFHKEIKMSLPQKQRETLLETQNFFDQKERYRYENSERFDKFITEEFQTGRVYGCQVVLTNPTSSRKKVDSLLQIPHGALPVFNGFYTKSIALSIEPYSTRTFEYYFYFPFPGEFPHFPVHVAENETLVGFTEPFSFHVVDTLTQIDKTSWSYISQYGTSQEVLDFLEDNNIDRLNLELIAFRMHEKPFFLKTIDLLQKRHVYHDTLWSYGIYHNWSPAIQEFMKHSPFANRCGLSIDSPLLVLNPIERYEIQHKEFWPLVNARSHKLGEKRKILNQQFSTQYHQYLTYLGYKPQLEDADRITTVVYFLLQERIEEAIKLFSPIKRENLTTQIQYDYLKSYLSLYQEDPTLAEKIAKKYQDYPIDRWRNFFLDVLAEVDEMKGKETQVIDEEYHLQKQTDLAATSPQLEFQVESRKIQIQYQNLDTCTLNFYPIDIEFLFSRNPFVQEVSSQFSVIEPHETLVLELPKEQTSSQLDLPNEYFDQNVMIELKGGGLTRLQPYYPHSLNLQISDNYGQLQIKHLKSEKPLSKVYVKVYARMKDGNVQFFKDGYTDLRGRFDYVSLNTNELDNVKRFSILILSPEDGALIRETAPPKR